MTRKFRIILIISIIGNLFIFYVAFKALDYRSNINFFLDKYLNVVNDFSQRGVHQNDNDNYITDETVPGRIVFIGSQTVTNWDLKKYFPDHEAINRGVDSQRVAGFLLRFKPDVIDLKPEYVFIEISSYNFRPANAVKEIEDYASTIAEMAKFHNVKPILTTIIPVREGFDYIEDYALLDSLRIYNDWIRGYSRKHNFHLIDLNEILVNESNYLNVEFSRAAIDLNSRGYQVISEEINKVLSE